MNVREWVNGHSTDLTIDDFIFAIGHLTGIPKSEILGGSKVPAIVRARHLFWACERELLKASYAGMARKYGVDHSTIIYAVRKVPAELVEEVKVLCTTL